MTALLSPPLAPLLAKLTAEASASDIAFRAQWAGMPPAARHAVVQSPDYRAFYNSAKDAYLAVSPDTARLLYMLARAIKASSVVEFGASFGISTLHLAAALKDNGGGRLISTEFEPAKVARLRQTIAAAALGDFVDLRVGDALETLSRDLPSAIDLVLLDGAKPLYPQILAQLEPQFRPGTLVVADNADDSPAYLARVRDPAGGYLSVPFAEDVELSVWLGRAG